MSSNPSISERLATLRGQERTAALFAKHQLKVGSDGRIYTRDEAVPARASKPTAKPTKPAPSLSQADVAKARASAMNAERGRWAAVFASEYARGREQGCAKLLANPKNWSAAAIIAELPNLPTDAERGTRTNVKRNAADGAAVWDKVYASADANGWAAAHAEVAKRTGRA